VRYRRRGEQGLDDVQRLRHSLNPRAAIIERKAGGIVLALQPTSAEAELEATICQQIDGGDLLRQQGGMAEVVVVHQASDP